MTTETLLVAEPAQAPVAFREAVEGDLHFLISSWLKSYRSSRKTWDVESHLFYDGRCGHKAVVLRLLSGCPVAVACHPIHTDQIYGWLCHTEDAIHYIYVKEEFQRMGIGRQLVGHAGFDLEKPVVVSHWHKPCDRYKKRVDIRYNPYLLMELTP